MTYRPYALVLVFAVASCGRTASDDDVVFVDSGIPDTKLDARDASFDAPQEARPNLTSCRGSAAGVVDKEFGHGGVTDTLFVIGPTPLAMAIDPNSDAIMAATDVVDGNRTSPLILRLRSDGVPDPSFSPPDLASLGVVDPDDMVVQSDGKVLVADARGALVRLGPDGTVDTSFGKGGVALNALGVPCAKTRVKVTPEGTIYLMGALLLEGLNIGIVRLDGEGAVDSSFQIHGVALSGNPIDIAPRDNGVVLIEDDLSCSGCERVIAFAADGAWTGNIGDDSTIASSDVVDPGTGTIYEIGITMKGNGAMWARHEPGLNAKMIFPSVSWGLLNLQALAVEPDGSPLLTFVTKNDVRVGRFTTTLGADTSFGADGAAALPLSSTIAIRTQSSGGIIVAGNPTGQTEAVALTRICP